jgi:hypothetical protein
VLLAAVAIVAIAAWGPGTDPALAGREVTVPDANPRLPANPEGVALVRPAGFLVMDTTKEKHGALLSAVLPEAEARVLAEAGVVYVKSFVGRDGEFNQGVWQLAVHDGADPGKALHAIDDLYEAGGWQAADGPEGVLVRTQAPVAGKVPAGYRAHYVRGPYLIRVEAYGPDAARVEREFTALADRQLAQWPPR